MFGASKNQRKDTSDFCKPARLKAFYMNLLECVRFADVCKLRISGNISLE